VARAYLAVTIALGLAGAVLIVLQAGMLARLLAGAARGTGVAALAGTLGWLGVVLVGRALAAGGGRPRRCGRRRWSSRGCGGGSARTP
jgi:ABC-type transport system involved in cytochrome bd biosynthesis fused ATPase/permease subunit